MLEIPACDALLTITVPKEYTSEYMEAYARSLKGQLPENVRAFVITEGVKFDVQPVQHEDTKKALDRIEQALEAQQEFNKSLADAVVTLGKNLATTYNPPKTVSRGPLGSAAACQPIKSPHSAAEKIIAKVKGGKLLSDTELKAVEEELEKIQGTNIPLVKGKIR